MSADETQAQNEGRSASPELQFDRVESEAPGSESAASGGIVCAMCQKPVGSQYYHVNGKQF